MRLFWKLQKAWSSMKNLSSRALPYRKFCFKLWTKMRYRVKVNKKKKKLGSLYDFSLCMIFPCIFFCYWHCFLVMLDVLCICHYCNWLLFSVCASLTQYVWVFDYNVQYLHREDRWKGWFIQVTIVRETKFTWVKH